MKSITQDFNKTLIPAIDRLFDKFTFHMVGRKSPTLLDFAINLEHAELYPSAIDTYLQFHLWLNSLSEEVKSGFFDVRFIPNNQEEDRQNETSN